MSQLRTLLGVSSLIFLWGCQTIPDYRDPALPAVYSSRFSTCESGEGGGRVVFEHTGGSMSSEYEWVSRGVFKGRLQNPMGQTLLGFASEKERLRFRGPLASSVPDIGFDEDGFFLLEGQWVGLRLDEAICLLKQKWPYSWLQKVVDSKSSRRGTNLAINEDGRDIQLRLTGHRKASRSQKSCAIISWNAFLFFAPQEIKVCLFNHRPRMTVDSSGYQILWDKED